MLSEESKYKSEWTYDEIVRKFHEWYEIDVGETYFKDAIRMLVEEGILEQKNNKYYYKSS